MRSSTLIASYLWKDTCSRWLEQPGSPLSRLFVTALLVAVAAVILISLQLLESSVRERLERFGLNTLLVRETIPTNDPELIAVGQRAERLAPLAEWGTMLRLHQLFVRGQSEWQNDLLVFSYPPDLPGGLAGLLANETPLICLSEKLPENALMRVKIGRRVGLAIVRRPSELFRPLITDSLLLVPQGWLPEEERLGHVETVVFHRQADAPPMARIVEAIQTMFAIEQRSPPQIQSALGLIKAWESLKERQRQWRAWLAGILGSALALVFGAIAVLEFRQNLFVTALLRSFGTPAPWLWVQQWQESALLANAAALAVIGCLEMSHATIFGALGFPSSAVQLAGESPYWGGEVGRIFLWVNIGALMSSLPVAVGLRQPVGKILT